VARGGDCCVRLEGSDRRVSSVSSGTRLRQKVGPGQLVMNEPSGARARASIDEIENALSRIPSVTAARVVTGPSGRIAEVHVLAKRDRAPKQLVRDVQSVVLASFGLEVDYRTVSVVQLDEPLTEADASAQNPRVALLRLSSEVKGYSTEIRVHVSAGGDEHLGTITGPASSGMKLVARAVVQAVLSLAGDSALDVDYADVLPAGEYKVAVAVLRLATSKGDQVVSGSAVVRKDANDAMARASLSALNRLLGAS
jgi:methionine synthase II (cobalamin-independent)